MRKKIVFGFLCLLVFLILGYATLYSMAPTVRTGGQVKGLQLRSQTWQGEILVVGDVFFVPWVTLTIEPGARILFEKNPDIPNTDWTKFADAYIKEHDDPTGRTGYNASHFDIAARINAVGTQKNPIIFTSAQKSPEYADWDQLVLFGGSILEYVELAYAHNGANMDAARFPFVGAGVTIANSSIHDSLWSCIDIWSDNVTIKNNEIYHCWHQGIGVKGSTNVLIKDNQIHDVLLSVNCELGATPTLTGNHFASAPLNPNCPQGSDNQETDRAADTDGGTYNGRLVYPSYIPR